MTSQPQDKKKAFNVLAMIAPVVAGLISLLVVGINSQGLMMVSLLTVIPAGYLLFRRFRS